MLKLLPWSLPVAPQSAKATAANTKFKVSAQVL